MAQAAVLTPGDKANLCPMVNASTVARYRPVHQNVEHDRLRVLTRRHEYIYGPSPPTVMASLQGLLLQHQHQPHALEEELARMLVEDSPSPRHTPPPSTPPRSDSSTPEPLETTLGDAVAFCYPDLVEFTHWQMLHEVQQLMDRFKAHLANNVQLEQLERPLLACRGVCPAAVSATSIPEDSTVRPTTLSLLDCMLLYQLRQSLATEPGGYQLVLYETQSVVEPPGFLCHCQPTPTPPPA